MKSNEKLEIKKRAIKYLRFLYPIWILVGMFSLMYVSSTLIDTTNAEQTAKNIIGNEMLFRLGIAGSLTTQLIHIAVVYYLYLLFKSVHKNLSIALVILGLVGVPIAMLNELNQFAALELVNKPEIMILALSLKEQGVYIAQIFWGLWLLPIGFLVYESKYFPRIFGHSLNIAGFAYLLDSFTRFLLPDAAFLPLINILMYGEVIFMGWVVLKGANFENK